MTNPTPDDAQFTERYLDASTVVDKLRDAVFVAGPSDDEQMQMLEAVNDAVPTFFMRFAFALGDYVNNQDVDPTDATLDRLAKLVESDGEAAMQAAFSAGGAVLGGALNDAGIFLRKTGRIKWTDKTPDAPTAAE